MSRTCSILAGTPVPIGLVGATATGKSELAMALAERMGGEIVSVDSMQVYRGLDIGTAKPTAEDRARVRHHLIDVVDLSESFDAAQFVRRANTAVHDIQQRGRQPIFCGGTGLYLQAFLGGLGSAPAPDLGLRARLESAPLEQLLAELERADPVTFHRIDQRNPRRVVRAVEVIRITGRPFSEQRAFWSPREDSTPLRFGPIFGLVRKAADLRQRMETRVERMFERGLVGETEKALEQGLAGNRTARQAIGYREVVEHLRGERGLGETIGLVQQRTRQYARRQMTWFRKRKDIVWLGMDPEETVEQGLRRMMQAERWGGLNR
jgi:tRNA dimethylallyltransferase